MGRNSHDPYWGMPSLWHVHQGSDVPIPRHTTEDIASPPGLHDSHMRADQAFSTAAPTMAHSSAATAPSSSSSSSAEAALPSRQTDLNPSATIPFSPYSTGGAALRAQLSTSDRHRCPDEADDPVPMPWIRRGVNSGSMVPYDRTGGSMDQAAGISYRSPRFQTLATSGIGRNIFNYIGNAHTPMESSSSQADQRRRLQERREQSMAHPLNSTSVNNPNMAHGDASALRTSQLLSDRQQNTRQRSPPPPYRAPHPPPFGADCRYCADDCPYGPKEPRSEQQQEQQQSTRGRDRDQSDQSSSPSPKRRRLQEPSVSRASPEFEFISPELGWRPRPGRTLSSEVVDEQDRRDAMQIAGVRRSVQSHEREALRNGTAVDYRASPPRSPRSAAREYDNSLRQQRRALRPASVARDPERLPSSIFSEPWPTQPTGLPGATPTPSRLDDFNAPFAPRTPRLIPRWHSSGEQPFEAPSASSDPQPRGAAPTSSRLNDFNAPFAPRMPRLIPFEYSSRAHDPPSEAPSASSDPQPSEAPSTSWDPQPRGATPTPSGLNGLYAPSPTRVHLGSSPLPHLHSFTIPAWSFEIPAEFSRSSSPEYQGGAQEEDVSTQPQVLSWLMTSEDRRGPVLMPSLLPVVPSEPVPASPAPSSVTLGRSEESDVDEEQLDEDENGSSSGPNIQPRMH